MHWLYFIFCISIHDVHDSLYDDSSDEHDQSYKLQYISQLTTLTTRIRIEYGFDILHDAFIFVDSYLREIKKWFITHRWILGCIHDMVDEVLLKVWWIGICRSDEESETETYTSESDKYLFHDNNEIINNDGIALLLCEIFYDS